MNFCKIVAFFCVFIVSQCAGLDQKSSFFTEQEISSLEKTLNILEYGFGFDSETELNYIYAYSYSSTNFDKKEKEFSDFIKNADMSSLVLLYDKIVKVRAMTEYRMNRYKELKEWRYYTFIKKDLYAPLDKYMQLLKKNILKNNPSLEAGLSRKEYALQKEVIKSYVKDEDIIDTF